MPTFDSQVKFQKIPVLDLVVPQAASPGPSSPLVGQLWWDTTAGQLKVCTVGGASPTWIQCDNVTGGTASNVTDGDKGDITVSSGVWTIDNDVVTFAKMQNLGPLSLIGNPLGGTQDPSVVGLGADLGFSGTNLQVGAFTGDITKAAGSLATTIGNNKVVLANLALALIESGVSGGTAGTAVAALRALGYGANDALFGNSTLNSIAGNNLATAAVNFNNQRASFLADGSAANDAVTLQQLQSVSAGLDVKPSVRLYSTSLTSPSGAQTVDGIATAVNDRVLINNPASRPVNGIYIVNAGAWTRAADMDSWAEIPGAFTFVEEGNTYKDTGWVCTADAGGALGSTSIDFTQFSGPGAWTAGNGLTQTGQTINAVGTANRISVGADNIDIDAAYAGQSTITTLGTVASGTWAAGIIGAAYGGTGANATTAAGAATARGNLSAAGMYTNTSPVLTAAGTWYPMTHTLNARARDVVFEVASSGDIAVLDWRVTSGSPTSSIDIRTDISGSPARAAGYYNVNIFS